jgi:prepilin-type N-terminal cleavage/methylation domain-containing protein
MKNLRRNLKNQKGFNLIELMIVIAIIALIVGIGIPAYTAMVNNANEASAVASINTLKTLQTNYASRHQGKFAPNFEELIKSVQLDERFAGEAPVVNGYIFKMTVQESSGSQPSFYSVNADPQTGSGTRHFYFDSKLGTTKTTEEERPAKADDKSI